MRSRPLTAPEGSKRERIEKERSIGHRGLLLRKLGVIKRLMTIEGYMQFLMLSVSEKPLAYHHCH